MTPFQVEEHHIQASDGTQLAYHCVGTGPVILLCNGLGGSWMAWRKQIEHLQHRFRFISWDYRGTYRSGAEETTHLSVAAHVSDALAVLDAEEVKQFIVLGWSLGVQVALEIAKARPSQISAMALLCGVPGTPWRTVFNLGLMGKIVPTSLRAIAHIPGLASTITQKVTTMPELSQWAKRLGITSKHFDDELLTELAATFGELHMPTYLSLLQRFGEHDATPVLRDLHMPVLVLAGDRDLFTPRAAVERMARAIGGAELMVVPGGTHYVAVEYPELVNLRLEKFLEERAQPTA